MVAVPPRVRSCLTRSPGPGAPRGRWSTRAFGTRQHSCPTARCSSRVASTSLREREYLASAELYDPATGTWRSTAPMPAARSIHTATLLPNGTVLVVGGQDTSAPGLPPYETALIYDPVTEQWTATGSMTVGRVFHTATLLSTGKVLVAGGSTPTTPECPSGCITSSAELYDPSTGVWTATGAMSGPHWPTRQRCCQVARCSSWVVTASTSPVGPRSTIQSARSGLSPALWPAESLVVTRRPSCKPARCWWLEVSSHSRLYPRCGTL